MADATESDVRSPAATEYDTLPQYGSQKYWDTLYATRYANKTFDWYQVR